MYTRCPPKRVPSAARFFTLCRLTVQPPQSYSVGGQRRSGQLTGKPAGARPDYRGHWCAVSRGHPGRPNPPSPRTTLGQFSAALWELPSTVGCGIARTRTGDIQAIERILHSSEDCLLSLSSPPGEDHPLFQLPPQLLFASPPPEGSHRLILILTEEDSPWCETGWPGDDGENVQWDLSPPYEGDNWPDLSPTEGDGLLSPIPLSGEEMVLLPLPPLAGAEQQELPLPPPPPLPGAEQQELPLSLPPPPAEGEYLLVPPQPPWEDCLPLPPPPAEGEYLLVPPPPPWEGLLLPCLTPPKDACCSASPGVVCCSASPVEPPVTGYEGEVELPLPPPWPGAPLPSSAPEGPLLLPSPPEGPLLLPSPPEGPLLLPSHPEGPPLLLSPPVASL
ncbi:UNVERIFIED_CONTAM: hypothetical protein FKN15_031154 [Acipenser sinensis]